jgi:hypothetical protein
LLNMFKLYWDENVRDEKKKHKKCTFDEDIVLLMR